MSSVARRLGTSFEVAVRNYFRELGISAFRLKQGGSQDEGDVVALLNGNEWAIECKNTAKIDLSGGLDEAKKESHGRPYALMVKRRGKGVAEAYVVMPLHLWVQLAADRLTPRPSE